MLVLFSDVSKGISEKVLIGTHYQTPSNALTA